MLRGALAFSSAVLVSLQVLRRPLSFAIVDEVDSVLIDNCRNPLLISAPPVDVQDRRQLANTVLARPRFS